ncbi:hypothetical protein VNO77_03837 [Canavalia gladiata]|uniref:Uncharacterized protein n=1 Tax=Canavalia gladiata TaxID=3824 RepID=A0AAN9MVF7_CANGL
MGFDKMGSCKSMYTRDYAKMAIASRVGPIAFCRLVACPVAVAFRVTYRSLILQVGPALANWKNEERSKEERRPSPGPLDKTSQADSLAKYGCSNGIHPNTNTTSPLGLWVSVLNDLGSKDFSYFELNIGMVIEEGPFDSSPIVTKGCSAWTRTKFAQKSTEYLSDERPLLGMDITILIAKVKSQPKYHQIYFGLGMDIPNAINSVSCALGQFASSTHCLTYGSRNLLCFDPPSHPSLIQVKQPHICPITAELASVGPLRTCPLMHFLRFGI